MRNSLSRITSALKQAELLVARPGAFFPDCAPPLQDWLAAADAVLVLKWAALLHDVSELEKCRNMNTPLWGVNNRNLRTFEVTLQQTLDLLPELNGKTVVTESGIRNKEDVDFMRGHGVHTFLIGETFMRADDIEAEVKKLF